MSFIGVICESKSENFIEQVLSEELRDKKIMILKEDTIENLKNIKFETIIIMSNNKKIFSNETNIIKNIISKVKYLVVNADEEINLDILSELNVKVITYGFNAKSTITVSSVDEDNIMLCVQRGIEDLYGTKIDLQEFNIKKETRKYANNNYNGHCIGIAIV